MLIRSDFLGADCKKSAVTVWTSLPSSRVLSACVLHSCAPSCQLHSVTVPVKRRKKTPFPKSSLSSVFTISSCNHTPIKASSGYDSSINNKNIHLLFFFSLIVIRVAEGDSENPCWHQPDSRTHSGKTASHWDPCRVVKAVVMFPACVRGLALDAWTWPCMLSQLVK